MIIMDGATIKLYIRRRLCCLQYVAPSTCCHGLIRLIPREGKLTSGRILSVLPLLVPSTRKNISPGVNFWVVAICQPIIHVHTYVVVAICPNFNQ